MDQTDPALHNLLLTGIRAAQAKRKAEAYQLLGEVVRRDPQNEQGWLWYAAVAPTPQESLDAFGRVLAINPQNEQARVGQRWATARINRPAAPAAGAPTPARAASPAAPSAPGSPAPPAPPAASERPALSSESLANMFAPSASTVAPAAPPPAIPPPPAPEPPPPVTFVPPAAVAAGAAPPAAPEPAPAPPLAPAPDWRAAGDLAAPGGVNWDDDGAGLRAAPGPAAQGVTCPNCGAPGQTGAVCSLCNSPLLQPVDKAALDPALLGVGYTPAAEAAAPAPAAERDRAAAPAAPEPAPSPYTETLQPVARRSSLLPLLLGGLLLLVGLFVVGAALLNGANNRFDSVGRSFFEAHMRQDYTTAASYLDPKLQNVYMATHDLPDLNLTQTLSALGATRVDTAPLAGPDDKGAGEAVITLTPRTGAPVRYLAHLTHASGRWLVDQILPYSGQ
jgi:hypothetical protein